MKASTRAAAVCAALNHTGSRYLVIGSAACTLHGHIRPGLDVDILMKRNLENAVRVMAALETAGYPAARGWLPEDLLRQPVTVLGTEPAVTVFTSMGAAQFDDVGSRGSRVTIEGVQIPVMGLADLIAIRRTGLPLDERDVAALELLQQMKGE